MTKHDIFSSLASKSGRFFCYFHCSIVDRLSATHKSIIFKQMKNMNYDHPGV